MSIESQRRIHLWFAAVVMFGLVFSAGHGFAQQPAPVDKIDAISSATDWVKSVGGYAIAIWYLMVDVLKVKPRAEKAQREQMESLNARYAKEREDAEERWAEERKETAKNHAEHWTLLHTSYQANLHELTKTYTDAVNRLVAAIEKNGCRFHGAEKV